MEQVLCRQSRIDWFAYLAIRNSNITLNQTQFDVKREKRWFHTRSGCQIDICMASELFFSQRIKRKLIIGYQFWIASFSEFWDIQTNSEIVGYKFRYLKHDEFC